MAKRNIIRVFEGFAGYGGASFGLKKAKIPHRVIGYSDIEQEAIDLYEYNFPNIKNYGDITQIDETKLPDFDLFTGGFPCQPFSTVGKMLGELDTRGTLFYDIIRLVDTDFLKIIFYVTIFLIRRIISCVQNYLILRIHKSQFG